MKAFRRVLRVIGFAVLAVTFVICITGFVNLMRGFSPVQVQTDALEPEYTRGMIVTIDEVKPEEVSPGDIVAYHNSRTSITDYLARVISVDPDAPDPTAGYGGILSLGRSVVGTAVLDIDGEQTEVGFSLISGKVVGIQTGIWAFFGWMGFKRWTILVGFIIAVLCIIGSFEPDGRDYLRRKAEKEMRRQEENRNRNRNGRR